MTPHEYATEVMRVISDGTVRVGAWSERDRDLILMTLKYNYRVPFMAGLELIIDSPHVANFRLIQDADDRRRVRLGDWRRPVVGESGERADVAAVNEKLAAIGGES